MDNTRDNDLNPELEELEKQLRCPSGPTGVEVARMMNETNISMTLSTIEALDLRDGHILLEIGHGNGGHLEKLLSIARDIQYHGLDISELMFYEAQRINQHLLRDHEVSFHLYNGTDIPFEDNTFDRIMTVNTLYFWPNPEAFIREIARILKPGGLCAITFGLKEFMKNLPFVGQHFRLYDNNDVSDLIKDSDIELIEILTNTEQVHAKSGEMVERQYSIAVLVRGDEK